MRYELRSELSHAAASCVVGRCGVRRLATLCTQARGTPAGQGAAQTGGDRRENEARTHHHTREHTLAHPPLPPWLPSSLPLVCRVDEVGVVRSVRFLRFAAN